MDNDIIKWALDRASVTTHKFMSPDVSDITMLDMNKVPFGGWTEIAKGVYINVYYRSDSCYKLTCLMVNAILPPHLHSDILEIFRILEGSIKDIYSGIVLSAGVEFAFPPNTIHHMVVDGVCLMEIDGMYQKVII